MGGEEFPSVCGECDPYTCDQDLSLPVNSPIELPSELTVDSEEQLDKIYFGGRWWREGDTMRHSWGVGTFIVRFQGSSSVSINIGAGYEGCYFTCRVDDESEIRLRVDNSFQDSAENGMVFTGLSPIDEHVIQCGRAAVSLTQAMDIPHACP